MTDLRTFLRDIDDDELVLTALEAYMCIWQDALTEAYYEYDCRRRSEKLSTGGCVAVYDTAGEIHEVLRDLAERKRRLRDREFYPKGSNPPRIRRSVPRSQTR